MGTKMPPAPAAARVGPPRPLAAAIRPETTKEVVGQSHLLGPGKPLRMMLDAQNVKSAILWGPAGIGKTTIARAMAKETNADYYPLDATSAGVKDLRTLIDGAFHAWEKHNRRTIVFVDEIHRWTKVQQDVLLPAVEDGVIVLLGATTEKPQFAVNSTLLSRMLVFELKPLNYADMVEIIGRIKTHYATKKIELAFTNRDSVKVLINRCSGDARKLTTVLEMLVEVIAKGKPISEEMIMATMPAKHMYFDASGNEHFDLAKCVQSGIQHSDVDGVVYWLAKWISSGEDPVYIMRRLLITAWEDCATNPLAPLLAMAADYTVERVGLPECIIPMAYAVVTMAQSERNKTPFHAIKKAMDDVQNGETVVVPVANRAGNHSRYDTSTVSAKYVAEDIVDKARRIVRGESVYN